MVEHTSPERIYRRSFTTLFIVVIVMFAILVARLWYLQVIQGTQLSQKSEANRIRTYRISSSRGMIKDHWGNVIVDNRPSYDLIFNPRAIKKTEWDSFLRNICQEVDVDYEIVNNRLKTSKGKADIKVKEDISRNELARIETLSMLYQGKEYPLRVEQVGKRTFEYGRLFSHVVGYTGEIDETLLNSPEYAGYRPGDRVGRTGVEASYERYLRGEFGSRKVEEDARGGMIRAMEYEPAVPGKNLHMNIDLDLQRTCFRAMGSFAGAVVAMDPRNGRILALVSSPSFDPDLFNRPLNKEQWNELINDTQHPLQNKAIGGQYPPGSTFKIIMALAGLQEKEIKTSDTFECRGKWKYLDRYFRCHNEKGHGWVNFYNGIKRSCDVYYYKLGVKLGIDRISKYARMFGGGRKTNIDIPAELSGLVPSREWKMDRFGQKWLPGETLNTAIGQGSLLMTPLQLAVIMSAVANGGTLYQPQVVQKIVASDGSVIKEFKPTVLGKVDIEEKHFDRLKRALTLVVNDQGGSAYKSRIKTFLFAGKTGTSQVRRIGKRRQHVSVLPYERRDHALFVSYAPLDHPTIVVVVVCEHAGFGSVVAAPIARAALLAYKNLLRKHPELKQNPSAGAE